MCHTPVATYHPLSRIQSSARGPGLPLTRSFHGLYVDARASLVENDKWGTGTLVQREIIFDIAWDK
jgi:hypothetical protein